MTKVKRRKANKVVSILTTCTFLYLFIAMFVFSAINSFVIISHFLSEVITLSILFLNPHKNILPPLFIIKKNKSY